MSRLPQRELRALIALAASIAGAAALTFLVAWIVRIFQLWKAAEPLANIAYGLVAIIGAVLLSLGLAINRRSIRFSKDGFEASGGESSTST